MLQRCPASISCQAARNLAADRCSAAARRLRPGPSHRWHLEYDRHPLPTGSERPRGFDPSVLRRGNGPEPDTLDPQLARTDAAFNILRDVFEGLTAVSPDGSPVPAAAESWTVSPDGLEYRFTLRPGLRWSNGDPLRAADFVTGMRRLVDPKTASPYAQFIDPVVNAAAIARGEKPPGELGVTAVDDRTLVIRLSQPAPYLLGLLAQPGTFPVHSPSLAAHGAGICAARQAAVQRGVRARRLGARLARRGAPQPALLEQRADRARAGALPAHRGCGHGTAAVPSGPTRLYLRRAAAALPVDQAEPCARAAHRAAAQRLFLRLQPDAATLQGQPETAPGPVAGGRPGQAHRGGHRRWRGGRRTAGFPPGVWNYTPQQFDYAQWPYAQAAGGSATPVCRGGVFGSQAARRRAALQHRRSAQPPGSGGGGHVAAKRSASRPGSMPRSSVPCCRRSRRARTPRCSVPAGLATTTTPTPSLSCCVPGSPST